MRSLIAVFILSVAIVVGGTYCTHQTDRLMSELIREIDRIEEEVENEGYSKASELLDDMKDKLDDNSLLLASYIDHGELNKIELYISQLEVYLRQEEKNASLVCSNTLNKLFVSLPEDYKVKPENVF